MSNGYLVFSVTPMAWPAPCHAASSLPQACTALDWRRHGVHQAYLRKVANDNIVVDDYLCHGRKGSGQIRED